MSDNANGSKGIGKSLRPVTMRDVADEIGVSNVTVSLALRNSPRISNKTREKVQRVASEMGYRPNPMLSSLSRYRNNVSTRSVESVIAWIHANADPKVCSEVRRCLQGARHSAQQMGYRVDEFDITGMRPARLAQILDTRGIRGMIVSPSASLDIRLFSDEEFSTVRVDWTAVHADTHCVSPAHVSNVMLALNKIRSKGYRNVGYVGMRTSPWVFSSNYFCGFRDQLQGMEPEVLLFDQEQLNERPALLDAWIQRHQIDAILSDRLDVSELLTESGYRIPDDIALASVSVHDSELDAGVDANLEEVGRVALMALDQMLQNGEHGLPGSPRMIMVAGKWVEGSSLPFEVGASC